jgi:type III restriction enzyme
MSVIVQHVVQFIEQQNQERLEPVFDEEFPIGSTRSMRTWYTTRPCHPTTRSQISHMVADSAWEQYAANVFEKSDHVAAYAKNDHLGFQIYYLWCPQALRAGFPRASVERQDDGGRDQGQDSEQDRAKRAALDTWVKGVNTKGGFGTWCWDVAFEPAQIHDLVQRQHQGETHSRSGM